ncbi:hypothetical protein ACH3VR_21165 [Microbacterium sp. B2969]|uniref:Uncharacterized protein n=1 Tax=Microbacterium alkaliflavum TaxID=3248839 RepID=A0ABW7QDC1_9MICO
MTSHQTLRHGATITHKGESFTVHRVVGGTVVARDTRGHTRHLRTAQVLEAIQTAAVAEAPVAESPAEVTIRACESLGVTAPKPPTAAPWETDEVTEYHRNVQAYLREAFSSRVSRRPLPAIPRPVVHLYAAPETTPPQAA